MAAWLLRLGIVLALAYAALCLGFYWQQRALIYYPRLTRPAAAAPDIELDRGDGVRLRGWALNPSAPRPILYFGGNAERVELRREQFARLFPGRSVYLFAYRGYGASDGTPSEAALAADARAIHDWARARHPGQPIDVIGASLGSGVAARLAAERPVARLVLVAPFDGLAEVGRAHYPFLPVRRLLRDRFESARHLAGYAGPVLVVSAGRDTLIPAANTRRLIAALGRPPRVAVVPGATHDSLGADPSFEAALAEFLR
ncbi:alpha/beta hydrolase [Vulcaniibacterium tengchongense]|uniref:AB hydrolase-1 domain-containing protein n=1 Tax=Vulcaniibacterium tengchongense TaxID=1273429 RepID=A0A3N4VX64_9GAMM|nr:alpha/beta fold hydrolase [Vulcaniibacterium tengchongense]RPE81697.1 hypothetical protein EDC50_0894 [Vulcaniibacterium tengchongense]